MITYPVTAKWTNFAGEWQIVKFTSSQTGTVIGRSDHCSWKLGETRDDWWPISLPPTSPGLSGWVIIPEEFEYTPSQEGDRDDDI